MPLHLQRHKLTGKWYYQRRIPTDLRELNDNKLREYFSLGTTDRKEAEKLARQWDVKLDERWQLQRQQLQIKAKSPQADTLSSHQIDGLAQQWLEHLLTEDDEIRQAGLDEQSFEHYGDTIAINEAIKGHLARGNTELIEFEVEDFLKSLGLDVNPDSDAFHRICYAFLKVTVKANNIMQQRHEGEPIETPKAPPLELDSYYIDDAFQSWKLQKFRSKKLEGEWEASLNAFKELNEDLPISQYTKGHVAKYRDELLKQNLKADTIRKRLTAIRSVFKIAVEFGKIEYNPAQSINVKRNPLENQRQDYSLEDLRTIFKSPVFTEAVRPNGIGEAAYWVPLIGLFTGARPNEILQLEPEDVKHDEPSGIHYFDINTRGKGKSVKTAVSLRQPPIHQELIKLGLLEYVKKMKEAGSKLFPEVKDASEFSSWWNGDYSRSIGVWVKESKVFYSFRHSFVTAARASGIPEDYRNVIEGHSDGKGSAKDYGIYTLESKNEQLQKLKFRGLDLSHLYPQ